MKRKIILKKYTTFQIGGSADYFAVIKNEKELKETIREVRKIKLPLFIIGKGSNVLFSDKGYKGAVLKIEIKDIKAKKGNLIIAEAGASLTEALSFCLAHKLGGLEWAAGIPGTVGGAVRGNAGAFGKSMEDSVVSVKFYDTLSGKTKTLKKRNCRFKYRESIFKKKNSYIILSVEMKFQKKDPILINKEMKFYLAQRKEKQPRGFSAGSVFKNYEARNKEEILKKHPEIENVIKGNMIPAAYLIDKCELKGKTVGKAMISRVHANFIINLGQAKSSDVFKLILIIESEVKKRFGIVLEREIEIL